MCVSILYVSPNGRYFVEYENDGSICKDVPDDKIRTNDDLSEGNDSNGVDMAAAGLRLMNMMLGKK